MGFYDELADTAKTLLTEFGVPCSIEQNITSDYNVKTGEATRRKRRLLGVCIFNQLTYDFPQFQSSGVLKGEASLVQQGDVSITLSLSSPLSREELLLSVLLVNGERWQIVNCQPLKLSGMTIYYKLQARLVNG